MTGVRNVGFAGSADVALTTKALSLHVGGSGGPFRANGVAYDEDYASQYVGGVWAGAAANLFYRDVLHIQGGYGRGWFKHNMTLGSSSYDNRVTWSATNDSLWWVRIRSPIVGFRVSQQLGEAPTLMLSVDIAFDSRMW